MNFTLPILASTLLVSSIPASALTLGSLNLGLGVSLNLGVSGSSCFGLFGCSGLSSKKCYGAELPPHEKGSHPGWYKGSKGTGKWGSLPWSSIPTWDNGDLNFCSFSWAKNFTCCKKSTPTPPPSTTSTSPSSPCLSGYTTAFKDYTTTPTTGYYAGKAGTGAATIDNENYLTYGLVDSVQDCIAICNSINNCNFINVYQELESDVKDSYSPGKLTCAAFKACSGTEKATNYGGQNDITSIHNSNGYCKNGFCGI